MARGDTRQPSLAEERSKNDRDRRGGAERECCCCTKKEKVREKKIGREKSVGRKKKMKKIPALSPPLFTFFGFFFG